MYLASLGWFIQYSEFFNFSSFSWNSSAVPASAMWRNISMILPLTEVQPFSPVESQRSQACPRWKPQSNTWQPNDQNNSLVCKSPTGKNTSSTKLNPYLYLIKLSTYTFTIRRMLTLSWGGGVQFCTTLGIFSFTHPKYLSRTSIVCDFYLYPTRHNMEKFEGSSSIPKSCSFFLRYPLRFL